MRRNETSLHFLTGGKAVAAAGDRSFSQHDPVTGEVATVAAAASVADALKAVDAAAAAFPAWAVVGPAERRKLLNKAADSMDAKAPDFIAAAVALAFGNTVGLKSLELCPATHRLIGQCFQEAGLPPAWSMW
ncbi:MAG: aldehyde dehydrogenase family protein [Cypionkella sp.]